MSDLHLDVTGDQKMDVMTDASRDHHKNVKLDDLSLGAKKMGDPNMNCDQLSRDHLLCDHRKLRHRGKNLNLGAKNLDVRMRIHHVKKTDDLTHLNHVRKNYRGNPMMVDQRMDAKDANQMRNCGHLDDPVNGTMIYLQAWLLLFLKLGESDRYSVMFLKYRKVLIIKQIWS
jgi:hypothetical protein